MTHIIEALRGLVVFGSAFALVPMLGYLGAKLLDCIIKNDLP